MPITALNRVTIGDGTILGENVKIYDHNHRFSDSRTPIKSQGYSIGEVNVGKHCWIGSNVVLLKGTKIGDNVVIGAGCVIHGTITDNHVVRPIVQYEMEVIRAKAAGTEENQV